MRPRILIVGFGNRLAGDDGVGPAVVDRLRAANLPDGVRVEEGGTDALVLVSLWRGEGECWIVDALSPGGSPGTIHEMEHRELMALPATHEGAHALSLPESLRCIAYARPEMGSLRYRLFGVEVAGVRPSAELSPEIARAVPKVVERVLAALTPAPAAVGGSR